MGYASLPYTQRSQSYQICLMQSKPPEHLSRLCHFRKGLYRTNASKNVVKNLHIYWTLNELIICTFSRLKMSALMHCFYYFSADSEVGWFDESKSYIRVSFDIQRTNIFVISDRWQRFFNDWRYHDSSKCKNLCSWRYCSTLEPQDLHQVKLQVQQRRSETQL